MSFSGLKMQKVFFRLVRRGSYIRLAGQIGGSLSLIKGIATVKHALEDRGSGAESFVSIQELN
jgi:hypothetical protein